MTDLTDRQQAILDFVATQVEAQGLPPTLAEIAAAFGFNQTRGAHKHLLALEAKGHLTLLPGKARGIRLQGRNRMRPSKPALLLPILGRVAAGAPIGADADIGRHLLLDRAMFFPTPDYLLKVKGDSMIDDGIFDGDLIAVHRTNVAENGQIVVARIDGEITVKRFKQGKDRISLLPRNPDYAPIVVAPDADFAIEGLYCGLVRSA
ncbi:MAG: transcriptional repressor LexA [Arenimonas sp.]|nr:transcriptional repressor LexA [Arenimonas sp.]